MECQICYTEVRVGQDEADISLTLDLTFPYQEPTADLNWMECEACGQIVCFNCCRHPASKFCDGCIAKHDLTAELIEQGLMIESGRYEVVTLSP